MSNFLRILTALSLLSGLALHGAQASLASVNVTIRPAIAVTLRGASAIDVKLRLPPLSQAVIWRDENCVAPSNTGLKITQSGVYNIPLTSIEGQGSKVCITSTDGSLSRMFNLPVLP